MVVTTTIKIAKTTPTVTRLLPLPGSRCCTPTKTFFETLRSCLDNIIVLSEPQLRAIISRRKRALDRAVQSLGQHGLVGTSDDALMNLHDALKLEFERILSQYKAAVGKLEEQWLAPKAPVARSLVHGPAPTRASHQRQLSLRQSEIQERLIKNQSLLNVLHPALATHRNLELLLAVLQRRIDFDKDVLFQFVLRVLTTIVYAVNKNQHQALNLQLESSSNFLELIVRHLLTTNFNSPEKTMAIFQK